MRVASLVFAVIAVALPAAHAQTTQPADKAKPAAEAPVKPSVKPAAQSKAPASEASKAKVDGVATPHSMPANMKKNSDDCHSKGSAADA
jgi:hypothetical protein